MLNECVANGRPIPWQVGELAPQQAHIAMQQGFKLLGEFAKSASLLGELAQRRIKYWILKTAANCSLSFLTAHHGFSSMW
jgi:hypothetical protein